MFKEFIKYGGVTVAKQAVMLLGLPFLVELLAVNPRVAYALLLTLVYFASYTVYVKYVFRVRSDRQMVARYTVSLVAFWLINITSFYILTAVISLFYYKALIINIVFIGIFRFIVQKFLVFKNKK